MACRLMLAVVLLTLTAGCDRRNGTLFSPTVFTPGGLSVLIVSGGSVLTTTVFPLTPLTVPRGSTVSCIDDDHIPQPATIAGTVNPGIVATRGRPVAMPDVGTFTFGCAVRPGISVTIIVV